MEPSKWYVKHVNQLREKLDAFLEATMEKGIVVDGVVAQDNSQAASFWQIREVGSFLHQEVGSVASEVINFTLF